MKWFYWNVQYNPTGLLGLNYFGKTISLFDLQYNENTRFF